MRAGAKISYVPFPSEHRVKQFRILYQPPGSFKVDVHNPCLCNELVSLRNRVLMEVPRPCRDFVRSSRELAHRIGSWLGKHSPQQGEWVEKYVGRKHTIYKNAEADLLLVPFSKRDRYVKSFIKMEKVSDITRDPRTIQARTPRYNYVLGNYLKAIEHRLYNIRGDRQLKHWLPRGRLIAKGLDLRRRAYLCKKKMETFPRTTCLSIDASRFDAHVSQELLTLEHSVYKRCFPGDKLLQRILDYQLVNRGHTANGIAYKCPGGRMSGDMNTALGNCLLMVIIVGVAMRQLGFRPQDWNMLCDGDDTLIFIPTERAAAVKTALPVALARAGMNIKMENEATDLHDIVFCQGKIVDCADGLKFVQMPVRSYSRSLVSTRHYQHPKAVDKVLRQIGSCELAINMGVPVLQAYALAMLRNSKAAAGQVVRPTYTGRIWKAQREFKAHGGEVTPLPITNAARLSFEQAFGMPTWEQEEMERRLERVVF